MSLILILSFVSTLTIVLALYNLFAGKRVIIEQRLNAISTASIDDKDEKLAQPFYERVIRPFAEKCGEFIIKITPRERLNRLQHKIIAAGNPFNLGVDGWLSFQAFFSIFLPAVTVVITFTGIMDVKRMIMLICIEFFCGIFFPHIILTSKIQQRQTEITAALPDILDLLTVSVEAGLGFDAALGKVVEKIPGTLVKEFDKVLQEIKMGKPRKEALKSMSDRVGVVDLTTFIASVIQADQLGVSLSGVLRIQSDQMRLRRRQRAQEKAMKAPIKMLLPMVFFIFPTIFTVLLGPVVIKLLEMLK